MLRGCGWETPEGPIKSTVIVLRIPRISSVRRKKEAVRLIGAFGAKMARLAEITQFREPDPGSDDILAIGYVLNDRA